MKAILQFHLDNEEDAMAHFRCVKALDMALAVWTFSEKLRRMTEKEEHSNEDVADVIWGAWNKTLEDYGVKIDELIS